MSGGSRSPAGADPGPSFPSTFSVREPLRGRVYAALQGVRGRPLLPLVRQLREWERLDRPAFDRLVESRLRILLAHARERVPLYGTDDWQHIFAAGGIGPARGTGADPLQRWPVLERTVLLDRFEELLVRTRNARPVLLRTSGSSGRPLRIAFTRSAEAWNWAHRYRGMMWHGLPIAATALRLSPDRHPLRDRLLGQLRIGDLDGAAQFRKAERILVDVRPELVSGSPSTLFRLARYLEETDSPAPPAAVARVGGEQLFPFQRAAIEGRVARQVVDSYGCTEIGAVAGACPSGAMHVYAEHVRLEILRGDERVRDGEAGDVVLTSLDNFLMPLVRYRVGEQARLSPEPCKCGLPHPVITDLRARAAATIDAPDGRTVPVHEVGTWLEAFFTSPEATGIRQIQLLQSAATGWRADLESPALADPSGSEATRAVAAARLAEILRPQLGPQLRLDVRFVAFIPRQGRKHSYVRSVPL